MATQQDGGGVPFSIAHDLQQFRLLELPQEIVELMDAPNPPPLSIKSQAPSGVSGTPNAKAAYAVLCTPDKTFHLRQVHTSNSLFITQPTLEAHGTKDIPEPTTRAIASCATTLELHSSDATSSEYLEGTLPLYDIVDGEVDAVGNGKTKASIFAHIPLSSGQCERGWTDLIAFEFAGSSYRPSPNTLTQVWRSINAAALAEGMKLDKQFMTDDLARAVAEEGYPSELVVAICRYLSADDRDASGQWSCLDRSKTVQFIGKTLLLARHGAFNHLTTDFLETWKDCLPETWRADAELQSIEGAYDRPTPTTISAKGAATAPVTSEKLATKSSSRKWHEKFGRARKK